MSEHIAGEVIQTSPKLHNDVIDIYTKSRFYGQFMGDRSIPMMTKKECEALTKLVACIDHENVIKLEREALCELMGIDNTNINRKMRSLKPIIRFDSHYTDSSVPYGCAKIQVNPYYGWTESEEKTREQAIKEWFALEELSELSKRDFTACATFQEIADIKL